MGFFDFLSDAASWVMDKIEDAIDWINDKLSAKEYNEDNVDDIVDVDAVLSELRSAVKSDVDKAEKKCMDNISMLFSDLKKKTKDKFPDLVEIIESEQKKAENELKGTVMKYVKEHLSKNDPYFLAVLKMKPGKEKRAALDTATGQVLKKAEKSFNAELKRYASYILEEFTVRLNTRISDQEKQVNRKMEELVELQKKAEKDQIDIEALKDNCIPVMESAECIIHMFKKERLYQ